MDKEEYIKKTEELLNQEHTRSFLLTTKQKNKLTSLLKNKTAEGGMNEDKYRKMYPTSAGIPKFYGLPKIHKEGVPLRATVSSRGAVSYEIAKELARILKPWWGNHHTMSITPGTLYSR